MNSGAFLLAVVVFIVAGVATILWGAFKLAGRVADRGARNLVRTLRRSSRSLFGESAPPEELCRRLQTKHAELGPGVRGGLSFVCSGAQGRLDFISDLTEIRFQTGARARHAIEVSTPSFVAQLAEDDPESFRVRGHEELYQDVFVKGGIAPIVRGWNVPFQWTLGPDGFFLQIRSRPRDEEELWRWLKGSFRLLQALPGFEVDPAVETAPLSRPPLSESICQICGSTLGAGSIVFCARCSTPHHEDCWAYARECSTFACRETAFLRTLREPGAP